MTTDKKTKKLINNADEVISELIDGVVGAHPELLHVAGPTGRAVISNHGPRAGKVGIVVGGGSGHEPAFLGYVGKGLADAAAVGNVFASPSPEQIVDAAHGADGGAGVLFLFGNYTGDVMNFDMASEALAAQNVRAKSIVVTDDVASAPKQCMTERRGIAGGFFVFKCAGSAADKSYSMEEVERITHHANAMTRSAGVALGACSMPHTLKPNFELGDSEMEIGMGIHGEAGIFRTELETADAVSDRLIDLLMADLELTAGDTVAVLVNGLGSTSLMELYIVHRRLRQRLDELNILVHHSWVGNYVTSLEMAGASISLMKLDGELQELLDHPCQTPALQVGVVQDSNPGEKYVRAEPVSPTSSDAISANLDDLIQDGDLTPEIFKTMLLNVADEIHEKRDWLSDLDGAIGDGDHGVSMDIGWRAIQHFLTETDDTKTIAQICQKAGTVFLGAVGASVGPLYATAFESAASAVSNRQNLDAGAMVALLVAFKDGIIRRGGANPGDKTMVDAWVPACEFAQNALKDDGSLLSCLNAACKGAQIGMQSTERLSAALGRSAKLGDRSLGHLDPGAASALVIVKAIHDGYERAIGG